jgi:hypothetical protein
LNELKAPEHFLVRNYSAKKIQKVLDTVFLIFFNLSRHRTLVTRHLLAEAQALAERA